MNISAALTPEEWNAAYFLGLESIFQRDCKCNVPEQVLEGTRILSEAGYRFHHFDPARARTIAGYVTPDGVHELPCQEIADGSFAMVHRARDAVRWLTTHAPPVSLCWLVGLLRTYDQLHPEPAGDGPSNQTSGKGSMLPPQHPGTQEGTPNG